MTMIDIGGNGADSGALSANAMALGADSNLVFTMRSVGLPSTNASISHSLFANDGLLTINRPLRINKITSAIKAKVASTAVGMSNTSIDGSVKVIRGATTIATLPFQVPPAGQIPAPSPSATLGNNAQSTVGRDIGKMLRFGAVRKDATGVTTVGAQSGYTWLGQNATIYREVYADISYDETGVWGNGMTTGPGTAISVVPYDTLSDKEVAPLPVTLSWPLGPFSVASLQDIYNITSATGNLAEGTVVQFVKAYELPDGQLIRSTNILSFTVTAGGGVSYNPGSYRTTMEAPKGSYGMKSRVGVAEITFYKLSTHSGWTRAAHENATYTIANVFPDGGISTPSTSAKSLSSINSVDVIMGYISSGLFDGRTVDPRVAYKVFSGGKQVFGPGTVYTSGNGNSYPWDITKTTANGGLSHTEFKFNVDQNDVAQSGWPAYQAGAPRGDQIYIAGEKVAATINIPSRANVTDLDIYVQEYTTTNYNTPVENNVPWKLIYSGPVVTSFVWTGTILNPAPTTPTANTTASYPATLSGVFSWDNAIGDDLDVLPGDQIVCALTGGTMSVTTMVQVSIPVTVID